MKEVSQFMVRGAVTQVQDVCTLKGVPVVQLALACGGDCSRAGSVCRVEAYDAALQAVAHGLRRGRRVQVSGRLVGRINDRGFYNYSLYADAILAEPDAGGAAVAPDHFRGATQKVGAAPMPLENEDIPF